ncbi:MAG TPA: enoyl-CoA hydratase-related protein [Candidatus Limnocylindrales bacterium]
MSSGPLVRVAFPAPAPFGAGGPLAGVALLTIDRPEALNAVSFATIAELVSSLSVLDADPECRCVVLTGAGTRAFAAGADIRELAGQTPGSLRSGGAFERWDELRVIGLPIVAAVRGYALGGGCELAMACDLIVAGEDAQFGQPEIKLGVIPGAGGTQRLTRAIGKVRAMELILTGRSIGAREAAAAGLVNLVVPAEETLDRALELAGRIAAMPPLAVRAAKAMVNRVDETALTQGLADERQAFFDLFATEDQSEGMAAFTEKRTPTWRGR